MNNYPEICDYIIEQKANNVAAIESAYYRCSTYLGSPTTWEDVAFASTISIPIAIIICFILWIISK